MNSQIPESVIPFVDRRNSATDALPAGRERRQFANNYDSLSPEARELALATDKYKLDHRRRFITYEEMLGIMKQLGYGKLEGASTSI